MIKPFKHQLISGGFTAICLVLGVAQTMAQTLPPVETKPPTANYKPAVSGQTRAPGAQTKTKINVTIINHALKSPFGLRCLPDGRFIVTEKGGTMKILKADGSLNNSIAGLPAVAVGDQGGLLDVNFDSHFNKNRTLFWSYSEQVPEGFQLAV